MQRELDSLDQQPEAEPDFEKAERNHEGQNSRDLETRDSRTQPVPPWEWRKRSQGRVLER